MGTFRLRDKQASVPVGDMEAKARRRLRFAALVLPLVLIAALLAELAPSSSLPDVDPIACTGNAITCENQLAGNPASEWDVDDGGDPSIVGFTTDISANVGTPVKFKINTNARAYTIDIYRMGYYQGNGARKVTSISPSATLPQSQPACLSDSSTGLVDCGNWGVSATWNVPSTAVSGVYFAKIRRNDTGAASHIVFVVRNDASRSDLLFQTSDTTWQAYNKFGGNSFYAGEPAGRAYKLSYNRPFTTRSDVPDGRDWVFANEYPAIRWMERNGYDVSYQSGVDTDRFGSLLTNHKAFLSVGHDEYWSGAQRTNVEAARDAGVNLSFFSGNEVYWKTRYEPSIDGTNTSYRTLVSYKETWSNGKIDPSSEWTGTWRDPRFSPPSNGGRPENALTGTIYQANCCNTNIKVPSADGKMRIWRNTSVATQTSTGVAILADGTLGYEYDTDMDNGFRPAGLIRLSTTDTVSDEKLLDWGSTVGTGPVTHSLTLYRAASGALVFGAGTVQWTWGLDANHDGPNGGDGNPAEDSRMQQATLNLFADMGVQPTTRQANLFAATKSTDVSAPTAAISAPAANATLAGSSTVTISGTATDAGGGQVGGIEVSTDNGSTWHPANGRTAWTYSWSVQGFGPTVIKVRATDDSGNIQGTPTARTVNVTCPCTAFGATAPFVTTTNDASPVTLGTKFRTDVAGSVTGVRFYKGAGNTGTHVGSLWTSAGVLLAQGTFTNESASGWQTLNFGTPVTIDPDTTYVVSYYAPVGRYAADQNAFNGKGVDRAPIHILADGIDGSNSIYGLGNTFPTETYGSTNYGVDVVFSAVWGPDVTAPSVTATSPASGATVIPVTNTVSATFSEVVQPATISVALKTGTTNVNGTGTYDAATRTYTFTPATTLANSTVYTATVSGAKDTAGNTMAPYSFSFTTASASLGSCPCSIFKSTDVPAVPAAADASAVEVGTKFRANANGFITGVRFYKGAGNTGTHVGNLWSSTGTKLATVTFTGESASGWQQANFASPVSVTAGQTYLISYYAPNGKYSVTSGGFTSAVVNGPLTGLANGTDGPNGVYRYGANGGFPTDSWNASNYWVDAVYVPAADVTPPTVTVESPTAGSVGAPVSSVISAGFSEAIQPATVSISVTGPNGQITGTTTYDGPSTTSTFTPSSPLAFGATYTATVSGAKDLSGNTMTANKVWQFTTESAPPPPGSCPCSIFKGTDVPAVPATNDPGAVEIGTKFRADADGTVTGVRFYKGAGNTGTHVGNLWTSTGVKLATVTFTNELATGWQQANFSTPVAITAGQTYVVSYFAPNGRYSSTAGGFGAAVDNGPLHGLANGTDGTNGVYLYGAAGGFPVNSWNATNYWVDVVYSPTPDTLAPTLTGRTPAPNATGVASSTTVTVTYSEPVQPATISLGLTGPGGAAVAGATTYDAVTRTATFTPNAALASSAGFTATASGAKDGAGNTMATSTWSFQTGGTCPCSVFGSDATPAVLANNDTASVNLGMRFKPTVNGTISAIKFYKGPGNTGTHVASLWSSTGLELSTVTFTNETASGWQTATLTTPIAVTAGTEYVVSYLAPVGRYSATGSYFTQPTTNGPLQGLAGLYRYASNSQFPTASWAATNYWVDVVFNAS